MGLLLCTVLTYMFCARTVPLLSYQLSNIFSTPKENSTLFWKVSRVMPSVTCLILIGCVTGAYLLYHYLMECGTLTIAKGGDGISIYAAIGLFIIPFFASFLIKKQGLRTTSIIFFTHDRYKLADMEQQFFMALQAVVVTTLAMLHGMYGFSITTAMQIAVVSFIITEILAFYKEYRIFSSGKVTFSHFFLYLCTLETLYIALLIGVSAFLTNTLRINI